MSQTKTVFKSAFILSIGVFVSKFLGLIYRIPLTSVLGSYGIGLYQMVFPIYTLLLDFSGSGAPNAISKIIAEKQGDNKFYSKKVLRISIKVLSKLGILFTLFLIIFSKLIAIMQGNSQAFLPYVLLSPSVFLVCILSCFRGYFQGRLNMKPTSISQILEQVFKLVFGLSLAYLFRNNTVLAVSMATFAITISEAFSLLIVFIIYKKKSNNKEYNENITIESDNEIKKKFISHLIPISIIGLMLPLSHVIDSFTVINLLSRYSQNATSLYGISSGIVHTIISLPVSICYTLSTVSIPIVSKLKDDQSKNKYSKRIIFYTIAIALPLALLTSVFSKQIISILFRNLALAEKVIAISLLRISSINVLLLSLLQTLNALLIAKGKLFSPSISMGIGIIIKTIITIMLVSNPLFNIYGSVIGIISCYFVCILINLIMIFGLRLRNGNKKIIIKKTLK